MLDVHPPHEPVHGWRDFLLHILTITIGLLIALGLEGLVEWQHHRHLVHEAEAGMHAEIAANSKALGEVVGELQKDQTSLKQDVVVLKGFIAHPGAKQTGSIEINYNIKSFDSVSWKTAQSTGALAYMPYDRAQEYADIYGAQDELFAAERQAGRDTIISLAPFANVTDADSYPNAAKADSIKDKIEVLQGQLLIVDSLVRALDTNYKKFLAAHPD